MSMEAVAKFYDGLREDEALQEGVKTIREQADFIAFARERGFEFTAEELDAFHTQQAEKAVPLSDDELDKAAGGWYNKNGFLITTLAYGCSYWRAVPEWNHPWYAVKGQCGSCLYWMGNYCNNKLNMRKWD